jgi:hypothetical protein
MTLDVQVLVVAFLALSFRLAVGWAGLKSIEAEDKVHRNTARNDNYRRPLAPAKTCPNQSCGFNSAVSDSRVDGVNARLHEGSPSLKEYHAK